MVLFSPSAVIVEDMELVIECWKQPQRLTTDLSPRGKRVFYGWVEPYIRRLLVYPGFHSQICRKLRIIDEICSTPLREVRIEDKKW